MNTPTMNGIRSELRDPTPWILAVSGSSMLCSVLLIGSFLRLRLLSKGPSKSGAAAAAKSSGPLARLVICKAFCDFAVAGKFFLAEIFPAVEAHTFLCFLEYFIGQFIALMSCAYNLLICVSLFLVFSRFSESPLLEIKKIVSTRNQVYTASFCLLMTAIPMFTDQTGPVGQNGKNCWIKDEVSADGRNPYRLTFFIPVIFANIFAINLLLLVWRRRKLFLSENRFLLVRLSAFVCTFVLQWSIYFVTAIIELIETEKDFVPGFYECILSFGGIANYVVWSSRPGCVYKSCFCCFLDSSSDFYTSDSEIGDSQIHEGGDRLSSKLLNSPSTSPQDYIDSSMSRKGLTPPRSSRRSFSPTSPIPNTNTNTNTNMNIPPDLHTSHSKNNLSQVSLFSPSEMDCSTGSGTPRETWITEGLRNDLLENAKNNEISLLSDDSEWDRV
ncbi:hypothetical protein TrST_g8384 [Triparma strigata]|uniref:Uncharacterized protein n=1 Tax=Triparma strigata TaxID=1606541 RepID=A0A9W6ZT76_9STRA|nr:hypothetical protein TrST_g8384 [Triparma strigata]